MRYTRNMVYALAALCLVLYSGERSDNKDIPPIVISPRQTRGQGTTTFKRMLKTREEFNNMKRNQDYGKLEPVKRFYSQKNLFDESIKEDK